ncbi:glycosyl hydrolase 115 family protein [Prevotella sp. P6B1]|uniref:glycosyl hydrolase 115 family protein n=1 Tax=Prevotella sp. P6B1 TaxID=1410613 RepID=UPI0009DCBCE4|nr:glycosyl hydrolase 115 family protein [Prevotella sp. P6B1]
MKRILWLLLLVPLCMQGGTFKVAKATVSYDKSESSQVVRAINDLKHDIAMVTGSSANGSSQIIVGTYGSKSISRLIAKGLLKEKDLKGKWESYVISVTNEKQPRLVIAGSDKRGTIYGIYDVSQRIGVSPWYWWADVPVAKNPDAAVNCNYYASGEPSVKYRGIFINDEDWGLKPWAAQTFEKELGDIGPKTYAKVCELLLRLKANMLAPAMHACTGAFYSHPESQKVADAYGIMITTSHCEPLLFNNAATSEWNKDRDGEWNYETNSATILKKLDDRIRDTKAFDNIYTMGMRGLHDEAMKGSTDPKDRARTLEKVFAKQREILEKHKRQKATQLPQIFVPYKETLDIYDAGLRVPDDITLVWPDDNYGYMKRVSNAKEQRRSGGSGVYYHLSYCGVPHDNLWLFSTAPMLMYEELLKAYTAGADRYWLLNVGDIKPLEIETQMFMDMAYNFKQFSYDNANAYQAEWLAEMFGKQHQASFQYILDNYYRLAWNRKPEFMGYEMEWDTPFYARLYDTDFSFETGTAQKRLVDYQNICYAYDAIEQALAPEQRPALFEMLGYAVHSAYQMNRKFLYAQANHETGNTLYAEQCRDANREINKLLERYNTQLDGKWNQMISEVPPGYTALYHQMPALTDKPTTAYRLPDNQRHPEFDYKIDLAKLNVKAPIKLLDGMGTDWQVLQMGQPLDEKAKGSIDIVIPTLSARADSIQLCISVVPMWPVSADRSNRLAVSVDQGKTTTLENKFKEWGREWKIQIQENRKDFVLTLPLDKAKRQHVITLSIVDPGQIVQKITYQPIY